MTDDLIKRLRDDAAAYRKSVYDPDPEKVDVMFTLDYQWIDKPHRHVGDLCGELDKAADRIEAQAKEIERLREALEHIGIYGCGMLNQPPAMNGPEEDWLKQRIFEMERTARAALAGGSEAGEHLK